MAGNSFDEAIESETSGNLCNAYKAIVAITRDHHAYYAQKLYDSMRGIGTDDDALIRHVVGRSEVNGFWVKHHHARPNVHRDMFTVIRLHALP